ncbi:MAG: acetylglucosamine-6-sulfatase, partial [Planctomycetota bacterium]|nr:acetylglucosamine-6-sulfatase [Planctomycetota bacterium]
GDGSPDRHLPELYHLASDPGERHNLSQDPRYQKQMEFLKTRLQQLQKETGGLPDKMPLDEGIKTELPDEDIR